MIDYHLSQNVTLPQDVINTPPTNAVLSLWNPNAKGFGGGWNGWRHGGPDDPLETRCWRPPCTTHVYQHPTPDRAPLLAAQPFGESVPFFVCNEAFGRNKGWCAPVVVAAFLCWSADLWCVRQGRG